MKRRNAFFTALLLIAATAPCFGQDASGLQNAPLTGRPYSPYANQGFPKNVYFGDTHLHTSLSADAGGSGTRLGPIEAYRFARGEQVTCSSNQPVKLARPYDFMAVADHSDGLGVVTDILAGTPNVMQEPFGRELHRGFNAGGHIAREAALKMVSTFAQGEMPEALNYQPGNPAYRRTWERIVKAAEQYNEPGKFTTLIGFEWTTLVKGNNLHRVVLLRDGASKALMVEPYTTTPPVGSPNPRDLWRWMAAYEEKTGGRILAIPHNGNLSNGMMFPLVDDFDDGKPLDAAYAKSRKRWEPLVEATQAKGDGESHPALSPNDEFANFDTWDTGNLDLSAAKTKEMLPGEYIRSALKRGLDIESRCGVNPYKFGLIGSTDMHTGLSTVDNDNFFGKNAAEEPKPDRSTHLSQSEMDGMLTRYGWEYAAGGIAAVWARENTREAIFDAMQRKETYATTGPRMRVRFFGGYDFSKDDEKRRDLARLGYSKGVPMGGDLPKAQEGQVPSFLVYSLRDPMGANLDRVQIIKCWLDASGKSQERVYDVAVSGGRRIGPDGRCHVLVGDTVDLSVPSWTNTIGASELGAVWTDPDFDASQSALYYARVIEIPTPRWTAYDAVRFGIELPNEVPMTTQERAYTSPIWYTP